MIRSHRKITSLSAPNQRLGQEDIVAALGAEILGGARKPGDRMPSDAEMLASFGVSRVVTREVIKTLAAKGMVASRTKLGTVVLDPSRWNWLDRDVLSWRAINGLDLEFLIHVTDVRRAVEPVAASLAAAHRSRTDIAILRKTLEDMSDAGDDRRLFAEADLRLHMAVSIASRNPFFQSFAWVIEAALSGMLSLNARADSPKMQSLTVGKHRVLVDAIEAGDTVKAGKAMLQIIQSGLEHASRARRKTR